MDLAHNHSLSSRATTPRQTRSSRHRPSGRRHLLLARACPRTDIAQQRRFRSGSAEHQEQRSAPIVRAAGRALARARTRTAPAVLINAPPSKFLYLRLGLAQSSEAEPEGAGVFGLISLRASCQPEPHRIGHLRSWVQGELQLQQCKTYVTCTPPTAAPCKACCTPTETSS